MHYSELSKEISYALRHAPQEYGLKLDEQEWVPVEDLINALKRQEKYSALTVRDIAYMVQASGKRLTTPELKAHVNSIYAKLAPMARNDGVYKPLDDDFVRRTPSGGDGHFVIQTKRAIIMG